MKAYNIEDHNQQKLDFTYINFSKTFWYLVNLALQSNMYRVFQLDMREKNRLLGYQKYTFKS